MEAGGWCLQACVPRAQLYPSGGKTLLSLDLGNGILAQSGNSLSTYFICEMGFIILHCAAGTWEDCIS